MHGGHFNQKKSMSSRQLASVESCAQSFMSAQKNIDPEFLNFGQNSLFYLNNK